jgi:predicted porin
MRKILLGTTGVVGAALLTMGAAQAQTAPTVRIGGYFDFSMGYVSDDADVNMITQSTTGSRSDLVEYDFRSDAEIVVNVAGKAANGMSYGATIELQVDNVGVGGPGTAVDTDEMWAFVSSPTLGTLQFGDQDSAANQMTVRAPFLNTSAPSGRWTDFVQPQGSARYMVTSINDGGDRTKIIYLSPQFFGFDFGFSYAPNGGEGERERTGLGVSADGAITTSLPFFQRSGATTQNEITAALRYRGSFGNIGVAAGFAMSMAEVEKTRAPGSQDPTAYVVGLQVSGFGLTVGGDYLWGAHAPGSGGNTPIANGRDNTTAWVIGATYTMGAFQFGAYYGSATADTSTTGPGGRGDREHDVFGIGAEYTIAPGLVGFANFTMVSNSNLEAATGAVAAGRNRDVDTFVIGVNVAF